MMRSIRNFRSIGSVDGRQVRGYFEFLLNRVVVELAGRSLSGVSAFGEYVWVGLVKGDCLNLW